MRRGILSIAWAALALALAPPGSAAGMPETVGSGSLDLFQKIARADLIVQVRIRDGTLRFAVVDVLRGIKGRPPAERLRIAFRDFNFSRPSGTEPIVFPNGEEDILFLVPDRQVRDKPKNKDIYELYLGAEGRLVVPAEGAPPLLEIITSLAEITRLEPNGQVTALADLLARQNPELVEAALDELARLGAETTNLAGRLVALLGRPSPRLRRKSLVSIANLFRRLGADDEWPPDEAGAVLAAVLERARNDSDETVRVDAVSALAAWPKRHEVEAEIKAIAEQDPAQSVRYTAERALFESVR